jgi:hypothetical protein
VPGAITGGGLIPLSNPSYAQWVLMGKPNCWVATQCHGDADGLAQGSTKTGFTRVGTADLSILIQAWNVKEPPAGLGIGSVPNGICADFDRNQQGSTKTGFVRVGTADLSILITNWLIKEPTAGPGIPANCNNP